MDRSERQRLQREQRELKAPQERSDEEIEAVPAERVCLERKSTITERGMRFCGKFVHIIALIFQEDFFNATKKAVFF